MSGQVEWESSIRTGSSASTSEPPLSPSHPAEKRRRLSAAHDAVHGIEAGHTSSTTEDPHDHTLQIDELSPHIHMTESASPPGGGGGGGSDEKGANGRTLKQTKRAAQNRAAQQAFRKRKEERIRELEEKERVLNALVARENEIVRREKLLAERERSSHANQNNGLSTSPSLPQGPATSSTSASASTSATNDWDRAFASAPVASPIQHIAERLEASNRANDILRKELEHLKDQLEDKGALVDSLRRSLEDLGAENRSLRDAIGRQSLEAQHQHQQQQSRASS